MSLYYQNVNGLRTKLEEIKLAFSTCVQDIIVLTETNLSTDICNSELGGCRFNIYRKDRTTETSLKESGGGVLVAVSDEYSSFGIPSSIDNVECIMVSCSVYGFEKYLICGAYIPPSASAVYYDNFCSAVEEAVSTDTFSKILIAGDFNLPNISWNPLPSPIPPICRRLVDLSHTFGLLQVNNITNDRGVTLDLIFSTDPATITTRSPAPWVYEDIHHPSLEVNLPSPRRCLEAVRYIPNLKRCNVDGVRQSLVATLPAIYDGERGDLNSKFTKLIESVRASVLANSPVKRIGSSYPPWFSPELRHLVKRKKILHIMYKRTLCPGYYHLFSTARSQCKELAKICFNTYTTHVQDVLPRNPKIFWSFVSSFRGCRGPNPSVLTYNGKSFADDEAICNGFADFFSSVFEQPVDLPLPTIMHTNSCLSHCQFTLGEVRRALEDLDVTKGSGPDSIPPIVLKSCSSLLAPPLHFLFNASLRDGVFPEELKSSYIIPIHKSGSTCDVKNYRPIAIQSVISKVFERLVLSRVSPMLQSSVSFNQHGFVSDRSAATNLVTLQSYIISSFSDRKQVDVLYLDFSKAFDRVNHSLLLKKLEAYGIHGALLSWFKTYLKDRLLTVKFCSGMSRVFKATSGVPQGSHLGPTLFNIFINDLASTINVKHLLFADDVKLYSTISSIDDSRVLQNNLNLVHEWCETNGMRLNIEKCVCITFHRVQLPTIFPYQLGNTALRRVDEVKDLGVVLCSPLIYEPHINFICAKANKCLGLIYRVSKFIQQPSALRALFIAYVRPHLEYSSVVWSPHQQYLIEQLNSVQVRFLRLVGLRLGYRYLDVPTEVISAQLRLPSLEVRRHVQDIAFLHKLVNGQINSPELLELISFRIPSSTRSKELFARFHHGTDYERNSTMIRVQRRANLLPPEIDLFCTSSSKLRNQLLNGSHSLSF